MLHQVLLEFVSRSPNRRINHARPKFRWKKILIYNFISTCGLHRFIDFGHKLIALLKGFCQVLGFDRETNSGNPWCFMTLHSQRAFYRHPPSVSSRSACICDVQQKTHFQISKLHYRSIPLSLVRQHSFKDFICMNMGSAVVDITQYASRLAAGRNRGLMR